MMFEWCHLLFAAPETWLLSLLQSQHLLCTVLVRVFELHKVLLHLQVRKENQICTSCIGFHRPSPTFHVMLEAEVFSIMFCLFSLHFSWLICWCRKWQLVSLRFASMEMTPAHMHVASKSSLFTSYITREQSQLYPNVPICLFSQS